MIDKLFQLVPGGKTRDVAMMGAGMLALLAGRKGTAFSLFVPGALALEQRWREAHPDVAPDLGARLQASLRHYERTHSNPLNRKLHVVGIPIILASTLGLLAFRPWRAPWLAAAGGFTLGWGLNFVGHAIEGSAPAFADDPLSFLTGPVWDLQLALRRGDRVVVRDRTAEDEGTTTAHASA